MNKETTEVWAVPGANHIIDCINPENGLTFYFSKDEAAILAEEPLAIRMKLTDWIAAQALRQHTPITWRRTTAKDYNDMLNVLPPIAWTSRGFLVGEPYDHDYTTGQPRYTGYREIGTSNPYYEKGYFVSSRPLTITEFRQELNK